MFCWFAERAGRSAPCERTAAGETGGSTTSIAGLAAPGGRPRRDSLIGSLGDFRAILARLFRFNVDGLVLGRCGTRTVSVGFRRRGRLGGFDRRFFGHSGFFRRLHGLLGGLRRLLGGLRRLLGRLLRDQICRQLRIIGVRGGGIGRSRCWRGVSGPVLGPRQNIGKLGLQAQTVRLLSEPFFLGREIISGGQRGVIRVKAPEGGRLGDTGKGLPQVRLIALAIDGIDDQAVSTVRINGIVHGMLRKKLAVRVEIVVKEAARGIDQSGPGGDEAPEVLGKENQPIVARLQLQLPNRVVTGEVQILTVHQIDLPEPAGKGGKQNCLLPARQVKGAEVEAALLPLAGKVEHAVGVVQLGHRTLQDRSLPVIGVINTAVVLLDVEQAVPGCDAAASGGQHI